MTATQMGTPMATQMTQPPARRGGRLEGRPAAVDSGATQSAAAPFDASPAGRSAQRAVVLASADAAVRQRLRESLTGLRWRVHEASGGAEALTLLEQQPSQALLMDGWLPDLEASELASQIGLMYPSVDVLSLDGGALSGPRSAHRHELLHALREAQQPAGPVRKKTDTAAWNTAPATLPGYSPDSGLGSGLGSVSGGGLGSVSGGVSGPRSTAPQDALPPSVLLDLRSAPAGAVSRSAIPGLAISGLAIPGPVIFQPVVEGRAERQPGMAAIPGLIGDSAAMRELTHLIRLVAPRSSTVLIEGETGTGKEVVAAAIHRLSRRANKQFVVLNCAAIPETLLEAELFGHTRGAFTGAVTARAGRIEAAHGGTLFLDEIGELPLAVQAKLLRFLECGELQRVGDNEITRVDVRVIAATHRDLEQRVVDGAFRLDLYHRLAVFPVEVPALRERLDDLPALAEHLLARLGAEAPRKSLSAAALDALADFNWPGNVRELAHVLERAAILSAESPEIGAEHIRCRRRPRC